MATQKERFLIYLQTCVKSTRTSESNPLFLGGNAPKDYARFLESDRLFDYNPTKWEHIGSMYDINDYRKALEVFNELIIDNDFLQRDKSDNQGWRRGAISHYVCFLRAQDFFTQNDDKKNTHSIGDLPASLQLVYYGAPGTGKSHTINEVTKGKNVIRTTFHPDSDYSSFVGAYKPTMGLLPICDELGQPMTIGGTVLHKEQVVYEFVEQAFLQAYVNAWKNRQVGSLTIDNGNYALSGMNNDVVYWRNCNTKPESKEGNTARKETIQKCYDGIAPEDTKTNVQKVIASYLKGLDSDFEKAWVKLKARLSTVTPQFLVIEEINRGNCAQIFGDIFQLLDRNDYGFSVYPINADKDMKKHLEKAFKDVSIDNADIINQQYKGRDVVKEVLNGDILLLPDNLYIWATMNTSDQSLFPIDSAFKRRWDWKYVPIEQPEEGAEGDPRKWKIKADGHWCYWWEFLQAINEEIEEVTHSEDKQLGYFFAKPQEGEYIDAKTFVSKVVFYLWNDVFKDENSEIFRYKKLEGKWDVDMPAPKRDNLYFRSFVKGREDVDEKMVRWFVNNLLKEHNVVLLDDGHQNPVTTDDISKEENIAWMRPYKEESPADADGTEDAIDGNNENSPNGEDQPTDQVKNVVG